MATFNENVTINGDLSVSGNTGIGTTTPDTKLQVSYNSGIQGMHLVNYWGTGGETDIKFSTAQPNGTLDKSWFIRTGGSTRGDYAVGSFGISENNNDNYRLFIKPGGNVGIGTTSPDQKLTVKGGGIGFDNNSADKKLYSPADGTLEWMTHDAAIEHGFAVSHQGTKKIYLNTNGNSYLNGGNLGIGTTSPAQKLDVAGDMTIQNNGKLGLNNDLSGQPRSLKLRSGYAGDETNAGTIAYRPSAWDPNSLVIVGAGTNTTDRSVKIFDNLTVSGNLFAGTRKVADTNGCYYA